MQHIAQSLILIKKHIETQEHTETQKCLFDMKMEARVEKERAKHWKMFMPINSASM
jgi:hypothetical protein